MTLEDLVHLQVVGCHALPHILTYFEVGALQWSLQDTDLVDVQVRFCIDYFVRGALSCLKMRMAFCSFHIAFVP